MVNRDLSAFLRPGCGAWKMKEGMSKVGIEGGSEGGARGEGGGGRRRRDARDFGWTEGSNKACVVTVSKIDYTGLSERIYNLKCNVDKKIVRAKREAPSQALAGIKEHIPANDRRARRCLPLNVEEGAADDEKEAALLVLLLSSSSFSSSCSPTSSPAGAANSWEVDEVGQATRLHSPVPR